MNFSFTACLRLFMLLPALCGLLWGCAPVNAVPIGYTLQKPGKVSINIYDRNGQVVRELMHGEPRKAGTNREEWDGRDNQGTALPPGDYSWKALATPGLKAEYLMSVGSTFAYDPAGEWWAKGLGSHGGPASVAVDETGFYVSAFTENIEAALIKMSPDGKQRLWSAKAPEAWNSGQSLALTGGKLFMLTNGGLFVSYDAATGNKERMFALNWDEEKPADMDATNQTVLVSYPEHNAVRWLEPQPNRVLATVNVPRPGGVALADDGTAFVISENRVLRVRRGDAAPTVLIDGLQSPQRLSLNRKNGELLVIEEKAQQVSRFSPQGRRLQTYGAQGGRRDGLYDQAAKNSFRGLGDVTALPDGGFWVAEPQVAPRRVARFDDAGRWQEEWLGGQTWAPWFFPEPGNPNAAWINSQWGHMMRVVIDYPTKTWKVHSTYQFGGMAGGLIGNHENAQIWEGREHNGQLYLCRKGDPVIVRVDKKNWKLVPVVVALDHIQHYKNEMPKLAVEWAGQSRALLWTDANGDGVPQRAEAKTYPTGGPWGIGASIDANFNVWKNVGGEIRRYPVTGWNAAGAPLYADFPTGQTVAALPGPTGNLDPRWSAYLHHDTETNELFAALNADMTGWGQTNEAYLLKYNPDKTLAWKVGRKGNKAGEIDAFRRILGTTHGCIALTNFSHEWATERFPRTYVWDTNGLWVGGLLDDPKLDVGPDWLYALGAEALAGVLYTDPRNGDVLLFGHWINEGRIYRITGWNGWERAGGALSLSTASPARAPGKNR